MAYFEDGVLTGWEDEGIIIGQETTLGNLWDGEGENPIDLLCITMYVDREKNDGYIEFNVEFEIVEENGEEPLKSILLVEDMYKI